MTANGTTTVGTREDGERGAGRGGAAPRSAGAAVLVALRVLGAVGTAARGMAVGEVVEDAALFRTAGAEAVALSAMPASRLSERARWWEAGKIRQAKVREWRRGGDEL